MWAKLAVDGYPLYQETYSVQAPLFIEPIGWAFRLLGSSIEAGRWVTLLSFVLLSVVMSWLAHRAGGWSAALLTVFLVGVLPLLFIFSRRVMAEVPTTALAVTALTLAFVYLKRQHRGWLLTSGLLLGASFITKALNPFVAVPIGLLLLWYHAGTNFTITTWPGQLRQRCSLLGVDMLLWTAAVCLPLIAVLFIYGPANVYDQLIAFRGDLRLARPGSWPETWSHFKTFITTPWSLVLLALGSIISAVLRAYIQFRPSGELQLAQNISNSFVLYNLIWTVWLLAGVIMLLWHTPLFPHHFIVLLPPLILLASGLPSNLITLWSGVRNPGLKTWDFRMLNRGFSINQSRAVAYGGLAIGLFVIIAALFNAPAIIEANQNSRVIVTGGREQDALKLLAAVSNPADFVMGDSQLLIYMAGRRTPPPLGDVALVAIEAGRQTSARMITLSEQYQAPAVVQWSLRLPWLPDYLAWVEANYLTKRVWDNDHIIYFVRRIPKAEIIPNAQVVGLGDSLTFRGFAVEEVASLKPGPELQLKMYWQSSAILDQDYTVFTQLLDSNGALVASQDNQPLAGYFPTSQWPINELVTDILRLPLPDNLSSGEYTLISGMYLLETLERLPLTNGGGDYLTLTTITIE